MGNCAFDLFWVNTDLRSDVIRRKLIDRVFPVVGPLKLCNFNRSVCSTGLATFQVSRMQRWMTDCCAVKCMETVDIVYGPRRTSRRMSLKNCKALIHKTGNRNPLAYSVLLRAFTCHTKLTLFRQEQMYIIKARKAKSLSKYNPMHDVWDVGLQA